MIIAFVLDDTLDRPDGVQQYMLVLGAWLVEQGHSVHYLVTETSRTDIANVHSLGKFVGVHFNGNQVRTPWPVSKRRIRALLREIQPAVLHVQLPYSPFLAGRVVQAAGSNVTLVGTFHVLPAARWHTAANWLLGLGLWCSLRRFSTVIAVSQPAAEFAKRAYGLSPMVVPGPVDVAKLATAGKLVADGRLAARSGGPIKVVFLGRLVLRKGVLQLIRAFKALPPDAVGAAQLVIGGAGPFMDQARELAKDNPAISFSGFVAEEDKANFLASADIAVFPSIGGESFGIILVEAMAAGAGVVLGGNNPGYASVLGEQPESLIDPADTPAFAKVLAHFITDAAERQNLHDAQQQLVQKFDIKRIGPKIAATYRR